MLICLLKIVKKLVSRMVSFVFHAALKIATILFMLLVYRWINCSYVPRETMRRCHHKIIKKTTIPRNFCSVLNKYVRNKIHNTKIFIFKQSYTCNTRVIYVCNLITLYADNYKFIYRLPKVGFFKINFLLLSVSSTT